MTMIEKFSKSDAYGNNLRNVDMMTINTEKSGRKVRMSARSQDYDYDDWQCESEEEEDKVVKISVLFKNEEMERKIEDLGWSAKDLNSLEKEIECRKNDLESNKLELSQKESEFTRRIEQLSKKHTDISSKITENDVHQKDLIATHRTITKKSSDIDRVIATLKQKMTNLNNEEISIRERDKFLKSEITKTKEKSIIVQKKKKDLADLDKIVDKKYLEIKTIEGEFDKKNELLEIEYNGKLQKSSKEISSLVDRANKLDTDIKINNKLLSDKKDEISNLQSELDRLDQQLVSTERYADRKEKEIAKKSAEFAKLQHIQIENQKNLDIASQGLVTGNRVFRGQVVRRLVNRVEFNLMVPVIDRLFRNFVRGVRSGGCGALRSMESQKTLDKWSCDAGVVTIRVGGGSDKRIGGEKGKGGGEDGWRWFRVCLGLANERHVADQFKIKKRVFGTWLSVPDSILESETETQSVMTSDPRDPNPEIAFFILSRIFGRSHKQNFGLAFDKFMQKIFPDHPSRHRPYSTLFSDNEIQESVWTPMVHSKVFGSSDRGEHQSLQMNSPPRNFRLGEPSPLAHEFPLDLASDFDTHKIKFVMDQSQSIIPKSDPNHLMDQTGTLGYSYSPEHSRRPSRDDLPLEIHDANLKACSSDSKIQTVSRSNLNSNINSNKTSNNKNYVSNKDLIQYCDSDPNLIRKISSKLFPNRINIQDSQKEAIDSNNPIISNHPTLSSQPLASPPTDSPIKTELYKTQSRLDDSHQYTDSETHRHNPDQALFSKKNCTCYGTGNGNVDGKLEDVLVIDPKASDSRGGWDDGGNSRLESNASLKVRVDESLDSEIESGLDQELERELGKQKE